MEAKLARPDGSSYSHLFHAQPALYQIVEALGGITKRNLCEYKKSVLFAFICCGHFSLLLVKRSYTDSTYQPLE